MANAFVTNLYPRPVPGTSGERLAVADSVVSFSTSYDKLTRYVVLDVQEYDVYVTFDGSNPSGTNGHRLYARQSYTWSKAAADLAKFIRAGSNNAVIYASEFTD